MSYKKTLLFASLFFAETILFTGMTRAQENKEVFKGTFFKAGNSIKIDQEIDGDVIVAAQELIINSKIHGDVLAVAENMEINGEVDGDVRVMARNLVINGKIGKNTNIFAIDAKIGKDAVLGNDLLLSSQSFMSQGIIQGDMNGIMRDGQIGNTVNGNIDLKLDDGKLVISPQTKVGGHLNYTAKQDADIGDGVSAEGGVKKIEPKAVPKSSINYFGKIVALFGMIALGMAVLIIDKKNTMRAVDEIIKHPNKSVLYGLLYFIIVPVIAIILVFTLIGVPIALILLALYFILLYAAQVFSGIAIGKMILKSKKEIWSMVFGMTVLIIFTSLPFIGPAFKLIAIFIGAGAIVNTKKNILKEQNG